MTHAVTFLTKTLATDITLEWLRVVVDPQVILKVSHLLEHLFAFVHTAHKKLTSSNCSVIRRLDVKVLGKRVYGLNSVVGKKGHDAFQSCRLRLKHFCALRGF